MEIDHKGAYPSQQQLPAIQTQQQQPPQLKKKTSPHSSDDESHNHFFMMSSDEDSSEEEEEEEEELDESLEGGLSEDEGMENSEQSEMVYRKRYWFLKRLAKRIIFVRVVMKCSLSCFLGVTIIIDRYQDSGLIKSRRYLCMVNIFVRIQCSD